MDFQEENMLKKHMAACLVATAFMAVPALAQTSSAPATQPSSSSAASSSMASSGQFLDHMQGQQWRASKLVGVNIYGTDNQKIGDVNDVLLDHNGKAEWVVIGVGGFLGIGEKDVALKFDQVQWKMDRSDLSTASTNRGTTATTGAGTAATGSAAGSNTLVTGSTTGATGGAASRPATTASTADRGYPDHGVVSMTKDQLKNAPSFRYSMADTGARTTTTTAPATTNPPASANPPATAPKQ